MAGLLEVIALSADDARRAQDGGADRVELLGTMDHDGLAPTLESVELTTRSVSIEVRPMVRLGPGFGVGKADVQRLRRLIDGYANAGAHGAVLGFLDADGELDCQTVAELMDGPDLPWTLHRAIDWSADYRRSWEKVLGLNGLDQVLTAGSAGGVSRGLSQLVATAKNVDGAAALIMVGGGLAPDHVPILVRAGVRAFHVGSPVRVGRSFHEPVDEQAVARWRELIDQTVGQGT